MAQVHIRMDDYVKKEADAIFNELGLNISSAVNIFLKQVIRKGGLPFEMMTEAGTAKDRGASMESLTKKEEL